MIPLWFPSQFHTVLSWFSHGSLMVPGTTAPPGTTGFIPPFFTLLGLIPQNTSSFVFFEEHVQTKSTIKAQLKGKWKLLSAVLLSSLFNVQQLCGLRLYSKPKERLISSKKKSALIRINVVTAFFIGYFLFKYDVELLYSVLNARFGIYRCQ